MSQSNYLSECIQVSRTDWCLNTDQMNDTTLTFYMQHKNLKDSFSLNY